MAPPAPAATLTIFGAVGDLTKRLLMPAVYDLAVAGLLDPATRIVGADHNDRDDAGWRTEIGEALESYARDKGVAFDRDAWAFVSERLSYRRFDFTNDGDYDAFAASIESKASALFYLAVSPGFFETIAKGLARSGLLEESGSAFRRLAIEKPFGRDHDSACRLNATLTSLAAESQLFRVDHFLGKEAVQGIPVLRFANRSFEPLFHRDVVASVQITAAETVDVAGRGTFYETTGALRDMIPNHLLSLLTLVAMEPPASFAADDVRDAKMELLRAVQPVAAADAVRGQYAGYRDEKHVAADSRVETYAALVVRVENERWRGVPFYLRTGKSTGAHVTTIAFLLHPPAAPPADPRAAEPEVLLLGIDPERGLLQRFAAKRPGVELAIGRASAGFTYESTFEEPPNTGYEALLYAALRGDQSLFQRADMIEREWEIVDGVLEAWAASPDAPESYVPGSAGPSGADELLRRNGDLWLGVAALESLAT